MSGQVPLHEHLIEQGFLRFVQQSGKGPLFYKERKEGLGDGDPTNPRKPRYVKTREYVAAWVRQLGVDDWVRTRMRGPSLTWVTGREVNTMDKEKEEGVLGTIADAAKTGMDAAIEGVSSAASAIADAVTGTTEKPRRRRRRSPRRSTSKARKAKLRRSTRSRSR